MDKDWILLARGLSPKESLDISNLDRIFSAAGRRSNALLEIALSCSFRDSARGISALSLESDSPARNSTGSLEIRRSGANFLLVHPSLTSKIDVI